MADFLARLAGRTLGLAATVQPIIAPMYAPGQQFVGAQDGQEGIRDAWGAVNRAPTPDAATEHQRREMSLQDGPPDEPPPGSLVRQTVHAPEMLLPLVPQENQPSIMPIQTPHTASRAPGGQPATWQRISLEQDEAASPTGWFPESSEDRASAREVLLLEQSTMGDRKGPRLYKESEVGYDGRRKRPHPTSTPLPPLREPQGRPLVGHSYNQGNQHEVAPVMQEPSVPVPTIQVTIGRIEVRAMPPANPRPQPRRSEPPVMGLEEYLNQRAKGGY